MQIFFLSDIWTLILCFVLWPIFQTGAALICFYLPDKFFLPESFFYRTHNFEKNGRIYEKIFFVKRWKHLLPDGGRAFGISGFKKKKMEKFSIEYMERFLIESARGEMTHWIAILPFWFFGFFTPMPVVWFMLFYAL